MGFAARCKDWLCLFVELALRLGYAPSHFSPSPAYGYRESQRLILYNRAQPKGKRASLTERHSHSSQRAAKPYRLSIKEVARSLKQRVNSEILHTTVFGVRACCLSPCRTVMFFASSPLIDG